jgi:CRISPR-associated protein Cas1
MTYIHLTEPGTGLHWKENQLVAMREEQKLGGWPLNLIDGVFVHDKVFITGPAAAALLDNEKPVAFLTRSGNLRGRLVPTVGNNSELRLAQYRAVIDPVRALEFCREMISAKISNGNYLLSQSDDNSAEISLAETREKLKGQSQDALQAQSPEQLLGIEGSAAALYFKGFGQCFKAGLAFEGRNKRPPTDPVNSLLSYGYSLTAGRLSAFLEGISLDPYLGLYHGIDYGRPSLALDLLEEFRAPVVDRLTLALANLRVLSADDFETVEEGGVYLKQEPRKKYLRKYEEHLSRTVTDPIDGDKTTLRGMMLRQAERLARALKEGGRYQPYRLCS